MQHSPTWLHEDGKKLPLSEKSFASGRTQSWNGLQQEITTRVQRKLAYQVCPVVRIFGNSNPAVVWVTVWVQAPNGREQYIGIANLQIRIGCSCRGSFLLMVLFRRQSYFWKGRHLTPICLSIV